MVGDPIAGLSSPTGALVSVYLNRPSPGGFSALITDTLRALREQAPQLPRSVQKSLRRDGERISDLANRLETETAPAYAVFASSDDDIFLVEALTHSVKSQASIGPAPYLRPLRAAPRPLRAGVLVADQTVARVFVSRGGHIDELGPPIRADIGKPNYGGFGGYSEHTVRSRAGEVSARLWKDAANVLLAEHQRQPFDFMVVGSRDEISEEIVSQLHPYLADLYRAYVVLAPRDLTTSRLGSEIKPLLAEVRVNRQAALAGRVLDTAWSGGQGVLGLNKTIEAANAQAVDTLVVAGWFTRSGVVCSVCGALGRLGPKCETCGEKVHDVDDIVSEVMDRVVAAGGSVNQIQVASPLDVEGVGAITRYPVKV